MNYFELSTSDGEGSQVSGGFSSQHRSQAESSQAVSAALSAQYTGPSEETNHDDANQEEAPKDADDGLLFDIT